MNSKNLSASVRGVLVGAMIAVPAALLAQGQAGRTADGRPDLQGTWSFATLTPMERPKEFGTKAVLTPEEARKYAEESRARRNMDQRGGGASNDVERAYNDFWWEIGRASCRERGVESGGRRI